MISNRATVCRSLRFACWPNRVCTLVSGADLTLDSVLISIREGLWLEIVGKLMRGLGGMKVIALKVYLSITLTLGLIYLFLNMSHGRWRVLMEDPINLDLGKIFNGILLIFKQKKK